MNTACPECGNSRPMLMEDNGLPRTDMHYTLYCIAIVDGELCNAQWLPNEEDPWWDIGGDAR